MEDSLCPLSSWFFLSFATGSHFFQLYTKLHMIASPLLQGDSQTKWKTEKFKMFGDGSYWKPPPCHQFTMSAAAQAARLPPLPASLEPIPVKPSSSSSSSGGAGNTSGGGTSGGSSSRTSASKKGMLSARLVLTQLFTERIGIWEERRLNRWPWRLSQLHNHEWKMKQGKKTKGVSSSYHTNRPVSSLGIDVRQLRVSACFWHAPRDVSTGFIFTIISCFAS